MAAHTHFSPSLAWLTGPKVEEYTVMGRQREREREGGEGSKRERNVRSESLHLTPGFWFLTAALRVDTQKLAEKVTVLQALQKPLGVERASHAVCADC